MTMSRTNATDACEIVEVYPPFPQSQAQRGGKASSGPSVSDDSVCRDECLRNQPGCVNTSNCSVCLLGGTV